MSRITALEAIVAGAQPLERLPQAKRYRPCIDIERARESWDRAHQHFSALGAADLPSLSAGYAPEAVLYHALLGELKGREIAQAAGGFLRQTANRAMAFQVENAAASAAQVGWTASYDFTPTGRRVKIEGTTRLLFGQHGIERQVDTIDRGAWSRQAFGWKGVVLSCLPGWRSFLAAELRLAYAVDDHGL